MQDLGTRDSRHLQSCWVGTGEYSTYAWKNYAKKSGPPWPRHQNRFENLFRIKNPNLQFLLLWRFHKIWRWNACSSCWFIFRCQFHSACDIHLDMWDVLLLTYDFLLATVHCPTDYASKPLQLCDRLRMVFYLQNLLDKVIFGCPLIIRFSTCELPTNAFCYDCTSQTIIQLITLDWLPTHSVRALFGQRHGWQR